MISTQNEDLDNYIDHLEQLIDNLNDEQSDDFYLVLEDLTHALDLLKTIQSERDE